MQQKLVNNISITSKIICLILLLLILLIAKSLFLLGGLTVLVIISIILSNKSVKLYVDRLKKSIFFLLFFSVVYIMFFRDIIGLFNWIYKIILIILLLKSFRLSVNFSGVVNAFYTILLPLKKINKKIINIDKKAYNLVYYMWFYDCLLDSKIKIKEAQLYRQKKLFNFKYRFLPILFYAVDKISKLEENLNLNFYIVKKEKQNPKSITLIIVFILFFIVALFKEVIL